MPCYHILRNAVSSRWLLPSLAATISMGCWQDTTTTTTTLTTSDLSDVSNKSSSAAMDNNHILLSDIFSMKATQLLGSFIFHPNKTSMESDDNTSSQDPHELAKSLSLSVFDEPNQPPDKPNEFDFIVVGNGNSGRQAIKTLKEQCPNASIAVIDPFRPYYEHDDRVTYLPTTVVGLHPTQRTLFLSEDRSNLMYRHAVLIATGARGAAPPLSLFDKDALDRVVELRSTALPKSHVRPAVGPEAARQITLMAASQGARIGILGSGWEAVELAVAVARVAGAKPPALAMGSSGPLAHVLPKYLSAEVAARLRLQGVSVLERSLVRYVQSSPFDQTSSTTKLELHTAKSYDLLETKRTSVDLLVVAPNVQGVRGTASLPTIQYPKALSIKGNSIPWYRSWSQLTGSDSTDPSLIACYADDGRIAVNAELSAASRVYAAGSVAKYANAIIGHALIAGEGPVNGSIAGRVAGWNMSRDYHERNASQNATNLGDNFRTRSFATESLPLWRSDFCSSVSNSSSPKGASVLDDIGIRALCVGNCDAERLTTYAFWWTNFAAQQRMLSKRSTGPFSNPRPNRYPTGRRSVKPVYGVGVVYYLDDTDNVRGIMLWGLPYATDPRSEVNPLLLDYIKSLLNNNGNALRRKWDDEFTNPSSTLAEESERIVTIALRNAHGGLKRNRTLTTGMGQRLPKPLCRYTQAKTAEIASLGFLKRRNRLGTSLLGEDIYVPRDDDSRAPTVNTAALRWGNLEHARTAFVLEENEMKSRPPKEDPLWLRFGDGNRGISSADALAQKFYSNLYHGRLADGSDPLNPRPNRTFLNSPQAPSSVDANSNTPTPQSK